MGHSVSHDRETEGERTRGGGTGGKDTWLRSYMWDGGWMDTRERWNMCGRQRRQGRSASPSRDVVTGKMQCHSTRLTGRTVEAIQADKHTHRVGLNGGGLHSARIQKGLHDPPRGRRVPSEESRRLGRASKLSERRRWRGGTTVCQVIRGIGSRFW